MHLESLSNGLGGQSMVLFDMACKRLIPATVSLTADTGWEFDRTWSNGRRASSKTYFDEIVVPLGQKYGFDCRFVQAVDKDKNPLPGLLEYTWQVANSGNFKGLNIPMFGSKGGRVTQRCTDKMKIRACRQEARRMGATTNCNAQGIHLGEADRRMSGRFLRMEGKWSIYQTQIAVTEKKEVDGKIIKTKTFADIKWITHYYPLVDLQMNRNACQRYLVDLKIPYLLSSECDGCPHKDLARWERTSPEVLSELVRLEAKFNGEFFFTDRRIPLLEAIEAMQKLRASDPEKYAAEADFGCQNAICGV